MNTQTTTGTSAHRYPVSAGFKSSRSKSAAEQIDRSRDSKLERYSLITLAAVSDPHLIADEISDLLDMDGTSIKPRITDLSRFGILQYGPRKRNVKSGKIASVIQPTSLVYECLDGVDDLDDQLHVLMALIEVKIEDYRAELDRMARGTGLVK